MAGFEGRQPTRELLRRIRGGELAGLILFSRNLGEPAEVAALVGALRGAASGDGSELLVGVDQEGGRVQRLRAPLALWPPMRVLGQIDDPPLTERVGFALGQDLGCLGFNLDFAPVLDVVTGVENTVIGDRSFGPDPELCSRHGLALARGLQRAGLLACGKHFPGHGGPVADSHTSLPVERRSLEELMEKDVRPFRAAIAAGWPLLMSAHVVYASVDPARPGTLSPAIAGKLLRRELGFRGVLVSDDMEMAAVATGFEAGEAAVAALRAGVDLLLFCHREDRQLAALEALVRAAEASRDDRARLEEAAARVTALRRSLRPGPRLPPEKAEDSVRADRHAALLGEIERRKKAIGIK